MTSVEIRQSFLDFFREKGHAIVPSSSLLPDAPNLLFTNAGMNQFVPIFLGQAPCPYQPPRAADTQKCIRAGGKHNDLEDVGFDTYHHTFFEMLGNWSFGDYFKQEAIAWAWELVVERWKFPASRLYATVYRPSAGDPASFDQEAYDAWAAIYTRAGLDPAVHIVDGNKKDNFWMMGETGPCGPCSELHVDLTPGPRELPLERQQSGRALVNAGDARCIEIWNLVFIQFNANPDGTFGALPARHVDTGMGFERVTSMIQATKELTDFSASDRISNYETDIFRPIFDELEKVTGCKYGSTLPASSQNLSGQEKTDVAFRVIADHVRTLSFSIADGIEPSNEGRGYVLRRILRRAVRYGRNLGMKEPFLGRLVPVLGATMGDTFPEVRTKATQIQKTLRQEEESFLRTLERGVEYFEQFADAASSESKGKSVVAKAFSGAEAFKLYDTYGFPLDLTELMARERGLTVDASEFDRLMVEQRTRSRAAQEKEVITVEGADGADLLPPTTFLGYDRLQTSSSIVSNERGLLALQETTFYAEMGGQVGDIGEIEHLGQSYPVSGAVRSASGKIFFHKMAQPFAGQAGESVVVRVDSTRRHKIEAHHSGTHLLNWALRKILGETVVQRGSYVGPDRLRFDFSHRAGVTPEELVEIERLINEKIEASVPVSWTERPYAEVKGDSSILQFFGDKYGDTVRVVSIGDFSRELCGGTHVRDSGNIGFFKIISESAIAAGVRRIEAASGGALIEYVKEQLPKQDEAHSALRERKVDLAVLSGHRGEVTPRNLWHFWESREVTLRRDAAQVAMHEREEARRRESVFRLRAATEADQLVAEAIHVGDIPFIAESFADTLPAYLPFLADALKTRWQGVAVLAALQDEKVSLLCSVGPAFTKKIQAGKIIQAIAPLIGGRGGGRPDLAQGGGGHPEGVSNALVEAAELVRRAG